MFVKICGITTVDDALLAAGLGADAVGMIFAESSRRITQGEARDIARRLPAEIVSVGVFRNERRERVAELANSIGLRAVQLHGNESPEDVQWVAERVPIVIKVFAASDPTLHRVEEFGPVWPMIDSPTPGSGRAFDWSALEGAWPKRRFILAGGLHAGNVAEAIAAVRPWGVDAASGTEASPGRKDPVKLRQFLAAVREAAPDDDDGGPGPAAAAPSTPAASTTPADRRRSTDSDEDAPWR